VSLIVGDLKPDLIIIPPKNSPIIISLKMVLVHEAYEGVEYQK
jgi:hypothetical protein